MAFLDRAEAARKWLVSTAAWKEFRAGLALVPWRQIGKECSLWMIGSVLFPLVYFAIKARKGASLDGMLQGGELLALAFTLIAFAIFLEMTRGTKSTKFALYHLAGLGLLIAVVSEISIRTSVEDKIDVTNLTTTEIRDTKVLFGLAVLFGLFGIARYTTSRAAESAREDNDEI